MSTSSSFAKFDILCNELYKIAQIIEELPLIQNAPQKEEFLNIVYSVKFEAQSPHFRFTLLSPFQGGKSTTFNILCGGRELSPTGFGLETSATIVFARPITSREEDHAVVKWRSKEEIREEIIKTFRIFVAEESPWSSKKLGVTEKELEQFQIDDDTKRNNFIKFIDRIFNLSTSGNEYPKQDKGVVENIISTIRSPLQQNIDLRLRPEEEEALKISWLLLKFYPDNKAFLGQKRKNTIDIASRWCAFPIRWKSGEKEDFVVDDVRFIFIENIDFNVSNENLQQLRTTVVDCPGFQASRFGSNIARAVVENSHAIIVLLGTEGKAISQTDIRQLVDFDIKNKVFWAYNARGKREEIVKDKLLQNDVQDLKRYGFDVNIEDVVIYNALLAYRALQLKLFLKQELPKETIHRLATKAKEELYVSGTVDDNEAAKTLIQEDLEKSYRDFIGKRCPMDLNESFAEEAFEKSKWQNVISRVGNYVTKMRSRAVLINCGISPMEEMILQIKQSLNNIIDSASSSPQAFEQQEKNIALNLKDLKLATLEAKDVLRTALERRGADEIYSDLKGRYADFQKILSQRFKEIIETIGRPYLLYESLMDCGIDYILNVFTGWQVSFHNFEPNAKSNLLREKLINPELLKVRQSIRTFNVTISEVEVATPDISKFEMELTTYLKEYLDKTKPTWWQSLGNDFEQGAGSDYSFFGFSIADIRKAINEFVGKKDLWKESVDKNLPKIESVLDSVIRKYAADAQKMIFDSISTKLDEAYKNAENIAIENKKQIKSAALADAEKRMINAKKAQIDLEEQILPVLHKISLFKEKVEELTKSIK